MSVNIPVTVRKCDTWWDCIVGISKFFVTICAAPALFGGICICLGLLKDNTWPSAKVVPNGKG